MITRQACRVRVTTTTSKWSSTSLDHLKILKKIWVGGKRPSKQFNRKYLGVYGREKALTLKLWDLTGSSGTSTSQQFGLCLSSLAQNMKKRITIQRVLCADLLLTSID
jgi:hypothetical protein